MTSLRDESLSAPQDTVRGCGLCQTGVPCEAGIP